MFQSKRGSTAKRALGTKAAQATITQAAITQATITLATAAALAWVALGVTACGPAQGECPETAVGAQGGNPTAGGESAGTAPASTDELSELLVQVLAPRLCDQMRGTFVGLPGDGGHEGPESGRDPSAGRWWIRRCQAEVMDGRLSLQFGGLGWTWLDQESSGFRVRQYLRFDAQAHLVMSIEVGYDRATRIASVWLRPQPGVTAQVRPIGLVEAQATGAFTTIVGGILELTGSSASDRARQAAQEQGSERLQQRLASGITVTFSLETQQMDFMLGALERGQRPLRPFEDNGRAWLINSRAMVWPGGLDVIGPIDTSEGTLALDIELEEGPGAEVTAVCSEPLERYLDAATREAASQAQSRSGTPPSGTPIARPRAVGSLQHVTLPNLGCPSVLLVRAADGSELPIRYRFRVTPFDGASGNSPLAAQGGQSGQSAQTTGGQASSWSSSGASDRGVRIQIRSAAVRPQNEGGSRWDLVGGEADIYVVVSSVPRRNEITRTEVQEDHNEATFNHWIPSVTHLADMPLRFTLYDEDVANDEIIGTVELAPAQIPAQASDLSLPIQGPTQRANVGTLRLRVQPAE